MVNVVDVEEEVAEVSVVDVEEDVVEEVSDEFLEREIPILLTGEIHIFTTGGIWSVLSEFNKFSMGTGLITSFALYSRGFFLT